MFKNRLLFWVGMIAILATSLAVSSFQTSASVLIREAASDFYERHPDWTVAAKVTVAHYSDYFERHPELLVQSAGRSGASDYFERHPELSSQAPSSNDLTDYYFRHISD